MSPPPSPSAFSLRGAGDRDREAARPRGGDESRGERGDLERLRTSRGAPSSAGERPLSDMVCRLRRKEIFNVWGAWGRFHQAPVNAHHVVSPHTPGSLHQMPPRHPSCRGPPLKGFFRNPNHVGWAHWIESLHNRPFTDQKPVFQIYFVMCGKPEPEVTQGGT